jgi:hypothetical protein
MGAVTSPVQMPRPDPDRRRLPRYPGLLSCRRRRAATPISTAAATGIPRATGSTPPALMVRFSVTVNRSGALATTGCDPSLDVTAT